MRSGLDISLSVLTKTFETRVKMFNIVSSTILFLLTTFLFMVNEAEIKYMFNQQCYTISMQPKSAVLSS